MGFSPDVVDRMSLWQFQAAVVGWAEANGGKREMDDTAFAAAAAAYDAAPDTRP